MRSIDLGVIREMTNVVSISQPPGVTNGGDHQHYFCCAGSVGWMSRLCGVPISFHPGFAVTAAMALRPRDSFSASSPFP